MVGERLGRYVLGHEIARGGMATVHLAQTEGASKWVAIKLIHSHLAEDRRFSAMFMDEARIASRIDHPNVCQVIDFGEERGRLYIVMEYLHGESLQAVIARAASSGGLPPTLAARIVADVARGLSAAHDLADPDGRPLEIVHRDVSPQNVLVLYEGISKITDFGVARAEGRLAETRTGEVKGKLRYMAPEQLTGKRVDRRTDVWSCGVLLWEATTGRRLFSGTSEGEVVVRVMNDAIPRPSTVRADYPRELEEIVMAALERDATRRMGSAGELADALEHYLAQVEAPISTGAVSRYMNEVFAHERARREALLRQGAPTAPAPDRRRAIAIVATMSAVGLVAGILIGFFTPSDESAHVDAPPPAPIAPAEEPPEVAVRAPAEGGSGDPAVHIDASVATVVAREEETLRQHRRRQRRVRETPPAAPGTLNLLAVPPADVHWRGRRIGTTPLLDVSLPAGAHTLSLRSRDGRQKTVRVTIRSGELTRRSVSLE